MKVFLHRGKLTVTASRVPRCADCGQRLGYEQRTFRLPVTPGEIGPLATGFLLERVQAWKAAPVPCGRCPESQVAS